MRDLYIEWDTGQMLIHMDNFFPCPAMKLNKLLKIIDLDWNNRETHIETLKRFFTDKIQELEDQRKQLAKEYVSYGTKAAETERMVQSRKAANGVPLTKHQLDQERWNLKKFKNMKKDSLSNFKKCEKDKEKFEKLLENLMKKG